MRKKFLTSLLLAVIAIFCLVTGVACDGGDKSLKVKFMVDGNVYATVTIEKGKNITMPDDPVKDGYDFKGWYFDNATFEKLMSGDYSEVIDATEDISVYAKFEPSHEHTFEDAWSYDDTYHWHASTCGHDVVDAKEGHSFDEEIVYADFEHGGYTRHFCIECGYEYKDNQTDPLDDSKAELLSYGDNFDFDGQTLSLTCASTQTSYGLLFEVIEVSEYAEYKFLDFSENEIEESYSDINEGDNYFYLKITSGNGETVNIYDVIIHRNYRLDVYFDYDGGTPSSAEHINVEEGEIMSVPEVVKTGYEIGSWTYDFTRPVTYSDFTDKRLDIKVNWQLKHYSITYNTGDGTHTGNPDTYTYEDEIVLNLPVLTGYVGKWDNGGRINFHTTGELVFTASYTIANYKINYVLGEGTNAATNPSSYTILSDTITLAAPTHPYGDFIEWRLNDAYGEVVTEIPTGSTEEITLFAVWEIHDFTFEEKDDGTLRLTKLNNLSASYVEVPATYDGKAVTEIGTRAFMDSQAEEIVLGDNVTTIISEAFMQCYKLKTFRMSASVTTINQYAFRYTYAIEKVYYGGTVDQWVSIDFTLGRDCVPISKIYNGNNTPEPKLFINNQLVTDPTITAAEIKSYAFSGYLHLNSITVSSTVTKIASDALNGCRNLDAIYWNADDCEFWSSTFDPIDYNTHPKLYLSGTAAQWSQKSFYSTSRKNPIGILGNAYFNGELLEELTLNVETIGQGCFAGCSSLKTLTIGPDVKTINERAFMSCGITTLNFNAIDCSFGDVYGNSSMSVFAHNEIETLNIGDGVKKLNKYFLWNSENNKITSISVPDTLEYVDESAFYTHSYQYFLRDGVFTVKDNVRYLGNSSNPCVILWSMVDKTADSVTIDDRTKIVFTYAFRNCSALTEIAFPNSIVSFGTEVLSECQNNIKSISLPFVGKTDGSDVFGILFSSQASSSSQGVSFAQLETITVTGGTSICEGAFGRLKVKTITLSDSIIEMGPRAFDQCVNLRNVHLPNSLKAIPDYTFRNCQMLREISIPDSVESIGSYAFQGCRYLYRVVLGRSVESINSNAFYYCNKIVEIFNKSNLTLTAGSSANGGLTVNARYIYTELGGSKIQTDSNGYTCLVNGDSVIFLDYDGTETELVIPENVTEIVADALYFNKTVTSVTIGANVTKIGLLAFYNCSNLVNAYFAVTEGWQYIPIYSFNELDNHLLNDPATAVSGVLKAYFATQYTIERTV